MKEFYSTREVAKLLDVSISRLKTAVWDGRIDPPTTGPGRAYLWLSDDIQRASWVLRHKSADDVVSKWATNKQPAFKRNIFLTGR